MACREKFRRINLDHPDTVFEEILMNRRQGETYCGDLRGDTGAEERTRRGCHVVEEENQVTLERSKLSSSFRVAKFSCRRYFFVVRPKHAHFSRFNKRSFNGRLPDKNTTNIFEQTRIFLISEFSWFFREKQRFVEALVVISLYVRKKINQFDLNW